MTTESQRTTSTDNTSEPPSDSELFAGQVYEELSERQVFAGDEDFFKSLETTNQATVTQKPAGASKILPRPLANGSYLFSLSRTDEISW